MINPLSPAQPRSRGGFSRRLCRITVKYHPYIDEIQFMARVLEINMMTANLDLLDGGAGNDSLNAEGGLDSLVGGAGSDDFTGVDDVKELLDYNPEDFNLRARSKKIETNKNPRADQAGILYSSPNAILNSWICFQQSISVVSNSRIAASWRLLSSMAS